MPDVAAWELLVGFVSATFVIPIVQRSRDNRTRALVTLAYSLVVGAGTAWLTGKLHGTHLDDARSIATSVLTVFVSALATYHGFAKQTGIAEAIEQKTGTKQIVQKGR